MNESVDAPQLRERASDDVKCSVNVPGSRPCQQRNLSLGGEHQVSLLANADVSHVEFRRYVTLVEYKLQVSRLAWSGLLSASVSDSAKSRHRSLVGEMSVRRDTRLSYCVCRGERIRFRFLLHVAYDFGAKSSSRLARMAVWV